MPIQTTFPPPLQTRGPHRVESGHKLETRSPCVVVRRGIPVGRRRGIDAFHAQAGIPDQRAGFREYPPTPEEVAMVNRFVGALLDSLPVTVE